MEKYEVEVSENGTIRYYQDGKLHRVGGPAEEDADGYKAWYIEGKRHRLDGPAVEFASGGKYWFIEGVEYTKEEFNNLAK